MRSQCIGAPAITTFEVCAGTQSGLLSTNGVEVATRGGHEAENGGAVWLAVAGDRACGCVPVWPRGLR